MADAAKGGRSPAGQPKPPGIRSPQPAQQPPHVAVAVTVAGNPPRRPPPTRGKKGQSCCCSCCICFAWLFFVLVVMLLLLAVAAAAAMAWYQPKAPEFRVERLEVSRFDLKGGSDLTSHLNANVDPSLAVLNRNEKVQFFYGPMTVRVATEYIDLGHATAAAFYQGVKNSTVIAVHTKVTGVTTGGSTGSKLQKKFKAKALALDIDVNGEITAYLGSRQSPAMPLTITCYGIDQGKVVAGSQPLCTANLFGMIPFS